MSDFETLKSSWNDQSAPNTPENGSQQIVKKAEYIKNKQKLTNLILSITLIVLVVFFFYITAYNNARAALGLGIMISVLAIRIVLELVSIKNLKSLKFDIDAITFKSRIRNYYKNRVWTHYVGTPLIIFAYCFGFVLLLPLFEKNLSNGFYLYIKISAVFVLIGLLTLIAVQVKKELSILKAIQN